MSFLNSSISIMKCDFKSKSCFSVVLGYPALALMGELVSFLFYFVFFLFFSIFFLTGFLCIILAVLELSLTTRRIALCVCVCVLK